MGKPKLTETKNGETREGQNQEHAHNSLDIKVIAHNEFVLADQTVSSAYYCDVL
jgi:hypothetical protein